MFFSLTRDDISPRISALVKTARNPLPVMRAMGTTFKSITEGTFNSVGASYRPKPWPAKQDGGASNLQRSTTLAKSFRLEVTATTARLSNPAIYAAIHQFGARGHIAGKVVGRVKTKYANRKFAGSWQDITKGGKGIPARPFYPVAGERLTPAAENLIARAGERAIAREAGTA